MSEPMPVAAMQPNQPKAIGPRYMPTRPEPRFWRAKTPTRMAAAMPGMSTVRKLAESGPFRLSLASLHAFQAPIAPRWPG
jgi:hypothetical protein